MIDFKYNDFQNTLDELRNETGFNGTFDTHKFINVFRAKHEQVYVALLNEYSNDKSSNSAFQTANAQIAKFLSEHSDKLQIVKDERISSSNDHGNCTKNQLWKVLAMLILLMATFLPSDVSAQIDMKEFSINFRDPYAVKANSEEYIKFKNDLWRKDKKRWNKAMIGSILRYPDELNMSAK